MGTTEIPSKTLARIATLAESVNAALRTAPTPADAITDCVEDAMSLCESVTLLAEKRGQSSETAETIRRLKDAIKSLNQCQTMPASRKRIKCLAAAFTTLKGIPDKVADIRWSEQQSIEMAALVRQSAMEFRLPDHLKGKKYEVPRDMHQGFHDVFDYTHWSKFTDDNLPEHGLINSPLDIAATENARAKLYREYDFGEQVPVDWFVWQTAAPRKPFLTKLGGTPYRPENEPWPTDKRDKPYTFVAQLCFLDSKEVLPISLPGDIMLVFFHDANSFVGYADSVRIEWWDIGIDAPMKAADVPTPSFAVPELTGVLHRTHEFPDAADIFEHEGYQASSRLSTSQGTKIGTETHFIQGDSSSGDDLLICALNSLGPSETWPFVDLPKLPETPLHFEQDESAGDAHGWSKYSMDFSDCGCMYFFLNKHGKTWCTGDCY